MTPFTHHYFYSLDILKVFIVLNFFYTITKAEKPRHQAAIGWKLSIKSFG